MRLTKDKLLAAWRIRKQIFSEPANEYIIKRFDYVKKLFNEINEGICYINGNQLKFSDGSSPSTNYFSCKEDDVTAAEAFTGVYNMRDKFSEENSDLILKIGCLLGGFSIEEHHMKDEYRIISNTITAPNDMGSLNSVGQTRHPSSHFADNNYFFNVIYTIHSIRDDKFDPNMSKLTLRWPTHAYYPNGDTQAESSQKEALRFRFPYKFFYMWTHDVLHPVSLMAYKNLIHQQDSQIKYEPDMQMNQDYIDFIAETGWQSYSNNILNMIKEEERGDNFCDEMSKLLSVIMIQDQQMKDIQELLEIGNKAIILCGPPGTGKTYHAKELVCKELGISKESLDSYKFDESSSIFDKGAWTLVQFHPNYTYEDFIGGISPNIEGNNLSYSLKEGIFKKFCDVAAVNKEKKFIIIIDEINRADLSSVFGELMYALEYRDEKVSIPNFSKPFVIPSNVYIIGTMNSIDKSLVTFDLALRRRFGFIKIMPNVSVLENILADYNIDESCMSGFINRCKDLNERIASSSSRLQLGVDYQIGHAYYGKIKDFIKKRKLDDTPQIISTFGLEKLWDYYLQPLLEEYLGNRVEDNDVINCLNSIKEDFTKPFI